MLENRLDKATIKYNEAQSIRKTYEEIVKKLKEERLTFDTQLATLDKLLKAKKADVVALEKMYKDANHAKDLAKVFLCTCFDCKIQQHSLTFTPCRLS